jgi:hypothetical protein
MSSTSPRTIVRGNLITLAAVCFLTGMFLAVAIHRLALHDYAWFILYLLPLPPLIFAAILNARRILSVVR